MFERLDARWRAWCLARPKALASALFILATVMLFVYFHVWGVSELAVWIAAAVLLPVPFQIWAMICDKKRRNETES